MRVICVDTDPQLVELVQAAVDRCEWITSLHVLPREDACRWCEGHRADAAILTIRHPENRGLELAKRLRGQDPNVHILFLSETKEYAYDAFQVGACGYGLLPCSAEELCCQLERLRGSHAMPRVCIRTIPGLVVRAGESTVHIRRPKVRELLALLVDRGEQGLTTGEGIAVLWPERPGDANVHALFRVTYKRLTDALEAAGVGCILCSDGSRRYIRRELVDCDLYRILDGDPEAAKWYAGEYLREYSWAEDRNGQLYRMLLSDE